jgi:hypothetical protein
MVGVVLLRYWYNTGRVVGGNSLPYYYVAEALSQAKKVSSTDYKQRFYRKSVCRFVNKNKVEEEDEEQVQHIGGHSPLKLYASPVLKLNLVGC